MLRNKDLTSNWCRR